MTHNEKQAIADSLRSYVATKGSQNQAARTLRQVSGATISQVLNGNWDLISDEMWRTIASQIGHDANGWQVIPTEGYNRMYHLLRDAQQNALVLAVTGDAGCGKSQAVKQYAAENQNVIVLSCSEYWNRKLFLNELLRALGRTDYIGNTVGEMVAEAMLRLKRLEDVVLVLDEADKLNDQVLHFFITIYNQLEDQCGILMCATPYLEKRIKRGVQNNRKGYREIYSRIGRKFIPMPVVNDSTIADVCEANGITDSRTIARIIDDSDCDLRRVKRLVHAAKQAANNQ